MKKQILIAVIFFTIGFFISSGHSQELIILEDADVGIGWIPGYFASTAVGVDIESGEASAIVVIGNPVLIYDADGVLYPIVVPFGDEEEKKYDEHSIH